MVTQPIHPQVIRWFKVYAAIAALMLTGLLLLGGYFIRVAIWQAIDDPKSHAPATAIAAGVINILCGLILLVAYLLPFCLKPKSWVWTYNLALICLGLVGFCSLPFCLWMLIYWLKPEVKNFYGRT